VKRSAKLWWGVAVCAALAVGFVLGIWTGGQAEQDAFVELMARANLDDNCRAQLGESLQAIIDEYEGKPAAPAP
jgi:hypothetical protein